jgi:TPR repeat protein
MPGGVFICYRREETAFAARAIHDRVVQQLERDNVFLDVDNIDLGVDWFNVLTDRVGACDALVAVIGRNWVSSADKDGLRRLDDPDDFVRIEIEAALQRNVRVIPVLVDGAAMPRASELPESLKGLARRQGTEVSPARFEADVEKLTRALVSILEARRIRDAAEADVKRRAEEERRAREAVEAERIAREDRERKEATELARAEEARQKAEAEAARQAEEERRAKKAAEAERIAREEREQQEAAEADRAQEARQLADAEAARRAEEERRAKETAEAELVAREERERQQAAKAARAEEARRLAGLEAARRVEEERRAREAAEAAADEARLAAEAEAARQAEEQRRGREGATSETATSETRDSGSDAVSQAQFPAVAGHPQGLLHRSLLGAIQSRRWRIAPIALLILVAVAWVYLGEWPLPTLRTPPKTATEENELGDRYYNSKDYGGALEWYRRAADRGLSDAQFNLGFLYENGWGVTKDLDRAKGWYQKAADQGDDFAKDRLQRLQTNVVPGSAGSTGDTAKDLSGR